MPLAAGTRLGPYEIGSPLGKGGMGEVYRARDTKLDREVAVKVLPDELTLDKERVARFEREAKLLASLNHPNIASIHGFEESEGVRALVLELVEGPTLAERIARGPIPVEEAIAIAKQMAEALEAGHEAGVVHRDLKPANVKVKDDGTVKVLDYGLAKAIEGDAPGSADSELSQSPTLTRQGTQVGVILGTAPYMSPEQAKGKRVDKRADIWAFGAVLYEMLTGKRAFAGEDVSETLAHVLTKEPEWEALPPETPGAIRQVLRVCLTKDAKSRVRDIADVRLAMEGAFETEPGSQPSVSNGVGWRPYLLGALAGALFAGATGIVVWRLEPEPPRPVSRVTISLPAEIGSNGRGLVALSPDGSRLVYPGDARLYVRAMDQRDVTPVPGTDGAIIPFFSPDGMWVGFWANGELKKVALGGGAVAVSVCAAEMPNGARWESGGTMVFGQTSGIFRVSANGGVAEVLVATEGTGKIAHGPQVLPGGKDVLFTLGDGANWDDAQVVIHSLETGERKVVIERGRDARYIASGHLLYVLDGTLMAVPFDFDRLEVTGGPVPMAEGVRVAGANSAAAYFSVSDTGNLVYAESTGVESRRTLVWVGHDGREEALAAPPRAYFFPRISPDGSRVALALSDQETDIWMFDFARETLTRFTFHPQLDNAPLWTPDGRQIVSHSHEAMEGSVFVKSALGTGQAARLTKGARHQIPLSLSPDGTSLLIEERDAAGLLDVSLVAFPEGGDPQPLLHSKFNETDAAFAPDGRFFAFASDESGRFEVYVRPFPNIEDGSWQISRDGGRNPRWARNERELFYESTDGKLMSVAVQIGDAFTYGNPETVIATPYFGNYDISPDSKRILRIKELEAPTTELVLVLNWLEELKRLVPADH